MSDDLDLRVVEQAINDSRIARLGNRSVEVKIDQVLQNQITLFEMIRGQLKSSFDGGEDSKNE